MNKQGSLLVAYHYGAIGVVFFGGGIQDVLDALICFIQHLQVGVWYISSNNSHLGPLALVSSSKAPHFK